MPEMWQGNGKRLDHSAREVIYTQTLKKTFLTVSRIGDIYNMTGPGCEVYG